MKTAICLFVLMVAPAIAQYRSIPIGRRPTKAAANIAGWWTICIHAPARYSSGTYIRTVSRSSVHQ
jgi:hypothetical protein